MLHWTKESTIHAVEQRARVKMENRIVRFVFLVASSSDIPAANDAAEIHCDRQASATNGSAKENSAILTTPLYRTHSFRAHTQAMLSPDHLKNRGSAPDLSSTLAL